MVLREMKMKLFFAVTIFFQVLSFGCATATGPLFHEVSLEEYKGKAVVYFYRNSYVGSVATYDLRINDRKVLPLPNKGYYLLILDPGTYDFRISHNSRWFKNTFSLQEDKTYYIEYWAKVVRYKPGFFTSGPMIEHHISSVTRNEAMDVLKKCRLIGP